MKPVWEIWHERENQEITDEDIFTALKDFRKQGTQGIESLGMLKEFVESMEDSEVNVMYEEDSEATLEILYDTLGIREAYEKFRRIPEEDPFKKEREALVKQIDARNTELQHQNCELKQKLQYVTAEANELDDKNRELKQTIINLKAKLYDAAAAGFAADQIFTE